MVPLELYNQMLRRGAVPILLIPQGYLMWTNTGGVEDLKVAAEIHYDALQAIAQEFGAKKTGLRFAGEPALG
jgi:hypothetical protein